MKERSEERILMLRGRMVVVKASLVSEGFVVTKLNLWGSEEDLQGTKACCGQRKGLKPLRDSVRRSFLVRDLQREQETPEPPFPWDFPRHTHATDRQVERPDAWRRQRYSWERSTRKHLE